MKPRRRLFYKYVVPIISIVVVALGASGAIGIYFSYKETRNALLALQQEKAASAAQRIEQFVKEIEHQIGWTALPQIVEGVSPLELRRFDYAKLQRQVHAITEATYIRADGCLQVQTSRLAMERLGDCLEDLSKDARFAGARGGRTYFGPVYFRKETEPYMAIAVRAGREGAGVTAVEVNLKFMWEVIQRIRIGRTGYAYVVNAEGHLIAHPDRYGQERSQAQFAQSPQMVIVLGRLTQRAVGHIRHQHRPAADAVRQPADANDAAGGEHAGEAERAGRHQRVEAALDEIGDRVGHDAVGGDCRCHVGEEQAPEGAGAQRRGDGPASGHPFRRLRAQRASSVTHGFSRAAIVPQRRPPEQAGKEGDRE